MSSRELLAQAISEDVSAALQKAGGKQVSPLHAAFYPLHAAVMAGGVTGPLMTQIRLCFLAHAW